MVSTSELLKKNKEKISTLKQKEAAKPKRRVKRPWQELMTQSEDEQEKSEEKEEIVVPENDKKEIRGIEKLSVQPKQHVVENNTDLESELRQIKENSNQLKQELEKRKSENEAENIRRQQLEKENKEKLDELRQIKEDALKLKLELQKKESEKEELKQQLLKKELEKNQNSFGQMLKKVPEINEKLKIENNYFKFPNVVIGNILADKELRLRDIKILIALVRLSLGFKKNYAKLSQKELAKITDIHESDINKFIKRLVSKGYIHIVRSSSNNNCYVIDDKLYLSEEDHVMNRISEHKAKKHVDADKKIKNSIIVKNNNTVVYSEEIDKVLQKFTGSNKFKETEKLNVLLVTENISVDNVDRCLVDLKSNGTLKGEACDRPFSYLSSGVYEKVLKRSNGESTKLIDNNKIWKILTEYNTNERLPESAPVLSDQEKEWVESKGGWTTLGQSDLKEVKYQLGIQ